MCPIQSVGDQFAAHLVGIAQRMLRLKERRAVNMPQGACLPQDGGTARVPLEDGRDVVSLAVHREDDTIWVAILDGVPVRSSVLLVHRGDSGIKADPVFAAADVPVRRGGDRCLQSAACDVRELEDKQADGKPAAVA